LSRRDENELDAGETRTEYYPLFLSFGILGGFASCAIWKTSIATTCHWFFNHRGIATGVVTSAGPLGGIIFPIMFEKLEPTLGFGCTVRILGFISLGVGGLAIVSMKTGLPSSGTIKWNANFKIFTDTRFGLTIGAIFFIDFACLIPMAYIKIYALSKASANL
jgi:hypothetical protein